MATGHSNPLLRHIHRLLAPPAEEYSDGRLLEYFLARRDEAAFAALVQRHGPMVFGLCRRVLHNEHDAEDAFQAAFLVLARKAASVRRRKSLGGWLHEVAYHIALRARAAAARRQARERQVRTMTPTDPAAELARRELRPVLDEELRRLPDKYREPLILCYLEGKTNEDAARQLGWPIGSMSRRLARGRDLLLRHLLRRGVALSAGLLTAALAEEMAAAAVPSALAAAVARTAVRISLEGFAADAVSPSVSALAEGGMRAMVLGKARTALVVLLAAIGAGAGAVAYQSRAEQTSERRAGEDPASPALAEKQAPVDRHGDSLPPGAIVRLGTTRLRHTYATVAFAPDGKALISAGDDGTLRYWEPATGKEKRQLRLQGAERVGFPTVFAADGKSLAGCTPSAICIWDTATGKERKRFPVGKVSIKGLEHLSVQVPRLALSPDGKLLAAVFYDLKTHDIHLWDAGTGKELLTLKRPQFSDGLAFSPDGKLLATVASDEGLRLWETATGKEVRKIAGAQHYLAFAPDGKRVAAVSRGGGVKVWNTADGKECFDLKPIPGRYPGSLAFAPDGKTLAIGFLEESLLWDIAGRKPLVTIPTCGGGLLFSPDGKILASSAAGSAIHLWEVATGKEIGSRAGHEGAVTSLAIAPDGHSVATFSNYDRMARVWDAASGRLLLDVKAHKYYARAGAFSADGRLFVTGGGDHILRAWDRKTGAELRQFTIESADTPRENLQIMAVALSSDGERLVSLAVSGDALSAYQLNVWDVATGKSLARRSLRYAGFDTRFSPDVRSMATQTSDGVVVTDTIAGQVPVKVTGRAPLAFSPDGQVLATTLYRQKKPQPGKGMPAGGGRGGLPEDAEAIALTELATGEVLTFIETGRSGFSLLDYSPDGRTLATADRDSFRLWDIATGKELFRRALPEKRRQLGYSFAESLAFLPGGDRLATGLRDSTVLIWDLDRKRWHAGMAVKDLDRRGLEALWADLALAGSDAIKAHPAVWTLAAAPAQAVPFLKDHLHAVPAIDAKQLQRLIADLDSPEFAVREAAGKKLASFGEQAEPALRQALEGKPSLEVRKRLEALLADAETAGRGIVRSPETLRTLRAIRALEQMATVEAAQLLHTLSRGDSAARITRQAREALQRRKAKP